MFYRLLFCLLMISNTVQSQEIIPFPNRIHPTKGVFKIPLTLTVSTDDAGFQELIPVFSASVRKFTSLNANGTAKNGTIRLTRNPEISGREAYRLKIEPRQVTNCGRGSFRPEGCFYGLQSLIQLLAWLPYRTGKLPARIINDLPRYEWRRTDAR